jgi:hypothetical protein
MEQKQKPTHMELLKKIALSIAILAGISAFTNAQSHISGGIGYFGENGINPGVVLEFEYEKMHSEKFSLPLRADLGTYFKEDYKAFFIDIHKGFRTYFNSGLFIEQSIGVGLVGKNYQSNYWYIDDYAISVPHGNTTVLGFMPSVTFGIGYNLSKEKEGNDLIWLRPKIYWDLGFRGLHLPYSAVQIGYTHTFKTK